MTFQVSGSSFLLLFLFYFSFIIIEKTTFPILRITQLLLLIGGRLPTKRVPVTKPTTCTSELMQRLALHRQCLCVYHVG